MRLHVLGSGTAIPVAHRGASGYALVAKTGEVLCLECGPGSTRRGPAAGIALDAVIGIAVSHHHVDHVCDLAAALFARNVHEPAITTPLTLVGPVGHAQHLTSLLQLHGPQIALSNVRVVEMKAKGKEKEERGKEEDREGEGSDHLSLPPFSIHARAVKHGVAAVGYSIVSGARVLAYSGDSGPCDALVALCRGAHVALLECSYPSERQTTGHLTPRTAGETAKAAGVTRLVLTHFYPSVDGSDIEAAVRATGYEGALHLAADGDVIEV